MHQIVGTSRWQAVSEPWLHVYLVWSFIREYLRKDLRVIDLYYWYIIVFILMFQSFDSSYFLFYKLFSNSNYSVLEFLGSKRERFKYHFVFPELAKIKVIKLLHWRKPLGRALVDTRSTYSVELNYLETLSQCSPTCSGEDEEEGMLNLYILIVWDLKKFQTKTHSMH